MTIREFVDRFNNASKEDIASVMEQLPRDVLDWAKEFEAMSQPTQSLHACDERCMGPLDATTAEILGHHRSNGKRVCWCECHEWNGSSR